MRSQVAECLYVHGRTQSDPDVLALAGSSCSVNAVLVAANVVHLTFVVLVVVVLWLLPSFLVGRLAAGKGRSFAAYFIVSLIIGWLIPLIVALVVRPRGEREMERS
jgi:hypothetical protein